VASERKKEQKKMKNHHRIGLGGVGEEEKRLEGQEYKRAENNALKNHPRQEHLLREITHEKEKQKDRPTPRGKGKEKNRMKRPVNAHRKRKRVAVVLSQP